MKRGLLFSLLLCSLALGQWQLPPNQKPMLGAMLDYSDPINCNLSGYWMFNEGTGNRVNDVSGSHNTATPDNLVWRGGRTGPCLSFNGTTASTLVISTPMLSLTSGTVIVWFCPYSIGAGTEQVFAHYYVGRRIYIQRNAANYEIWIGNGGTQVVALESAFAVNTWYQLALTWSGTNYVAYYNGIACSASTFNALDFLGVTTTIGGVSGITNLNGAVDSVRIYNRTLAPPEISQLYANPFAGLHFDPFDLWQAGLADGGTSLIQQWWLRRRQ